jgi:hypothetical protein
MTHALRHQPPRDVFADLADAARAEEKGSRPISRSVDLLRQAGLMADDGLVAPRDTARTLMRIGAANLSVGRLYEGHVNALGLINRYGTDGLRGLVRELVETGAVFGVWGADGAVPLTWHGANAPLQGGKAFASGLGTLTHALVTVNPGPRVRLALVDVSDAARGTPQAWDMTGMRATASGLYDFSDMPASALNWVGAPGDYVQEPEFVGGVWRIAALQVGAAVGLLDKAAAQLRASGRMQAEAQKARLMTVLIRAWAGMALVERAATAQGFDTEACVSTAIAARLMTEDVALDAIRAVEQSLGLHHFSAAADTGRMARDLSVYLRQAARDAFLQRAAEHALGQDGKIWGAA